MGGNCSGNQQSQKIQQNYSDMSKDSLRGKETNKKNQINYMLDEKSNLDINIFSIRKGKFILDESFQLERNNLIKSGKTEEPESCNLEEKQGNEGKAFITLEEFLQNNGMDETIINSIGFNQNPHQIISNMIESMASANTNNDTMKNSQVRVYDRVLKKSVGVPVLTSKIGESNLLKRRRITTSQNSILTENTQILHHFQVQSEFMQMSNQVIR